MAVDSERAKCAVIVVHAIYGVNQHMIDFCQSIREHGYDVFCPNLIKQKTAFGYSEEADAYENFMINTGFIAASAQIKHLIADKQNKYQKVFLVGFSVGATISWLCAEEGVDGILGYYGSRIRDYTEVTPKCPTLLFFPSEEKSFNVDELISNINKGNTKIHKFIAQHGFSDPYSAKYDDESTNQAFSQIIHFLLKHSAT